jgi:hypothetical protein
VGYNIYIGEAVIRPSDEHDDDFEQIECTVHSLRLDDAPTLPGDTNDRCNYRWPSYGAWTDFTRAVGLHSLFYDSESKPRDERRGLMTAHPGCVRLRNDHHTRIAEALAKYKREHPGAVAGFEEPVRSEAGNWTGRYTETGKDPILARLVWLEWWVGWALVNCENPAIYNS